MGFCSKLMKDNGDGSRPTLLAYVHTDRSKDRRTSMYVEKCSECGEYEWCVIRESANEYQTNHLAEKWEAVPHVCINCWKLK